METKIVHTNKEKEKKKKSPLRLFSICVLKKNTKMDNPGYPHHIILWGIIF